MRGLLLLLLTSPMVWANCPKNTAAQTREQLQPQIDVWLAGTDTKATVEQVLEGCERLQNQKILQLLEPKPAQWFEKTRLHVQVGQRQFWVVAAMKITQTAMVYRCDLAKGSVFNPQCLQEQSAVVTHQKPQSMNWFALSGASARQNLQSGERADPKHWLAANTFGKGQLVDVVLLENGIRLQLQGKLVADGKTGYPAEVLVEGHTRMLRGILEDDGKIYLDR
jgi:flagella basal body P-ring formation protein FlgA